MTEFVRNLEIKGFRALSELSIGSFGRVNLITGKNNAGKSSLLEAIRILVTGGALRTLFDILNYREELGASGEFEKTYSPTDLAPFCNLFTGFPDLASSKHAFSIGALGDLPPAISRIEARIGWFIRRSDPERQVFSFEPATADLFGDVDAFPALDLRIGERSRIIPFDRLQRRGIIRSDVDTPPFPCVYLDPFSSRSTSQLGALWDAIALTDVEQEVVKALKIVSPDIQAVSIVGSIDERSSRPRTAIARSNAHSSPVPLRSFGDGVNRLFGVILSLCNARNGVLLVDEIENGLHFSVQTEIWRTIFRLASSLNVQVFATSHSWDCVRAFQQAACESPKNGVLVRLSSVNDQIIPTIFTENELEIATREQIEVR
jgi:hypothetical protein